MKLGYLVTDRDIDMGMIISGIDYVLSQQELNTTYKEQDLIGDYKSMALWERRSSKVFDVIAWAERKAMRVWIPSVDLIFGGWEIVQAITKSSVDVVLFGSITPSIEIKSTITDIIAKKKRGSVVYAPLVSFDKHVAKFFDGFWNKLLEDGVFKDKTILAVMPEEPFIEYLEKHPDFCDELLIWSCSKIIRQNILEVIERNNEMATKKKVLNPGAEKVVSNPTTVNGPFTDPVKKAKAMSVNGTIAIGPLSVRKEPSLSSKPYKVLAKGTKLVFKKTSKSVPDMLWGMVNTEEWILIQHGTRKYVILDS